ncbi:hypothetical protein IAR55_005591 [Kwoniella newhampshirensis]|uniref:FAD-binding domain-containing protein n=1 Tax=Kwoniella newhampshirensis TaxID=1651941 RepID=A0AAW0YUF6_9TREE
MQPVLIVGAGPVGLLQALMLSRLEVPVILLDRHLAHLEAPKAHVISSRSLEVCRQYGLPASKIRSYGTSREDARWVRFVTNLSGEEVGILPFFRLEPDVLEYTPEDDTGVTSTIENTYTGEQLSMNSALVIACDGANSKIVRSLGISSEMEESADTVMTIHFRADLRPVVEDRVGMLHWIMDPAVRGVIIAYDLSGNLVLLHNFDNLQQQLITDAHNLAYKLAAAYHGWADLSAVLAAYQAERQPVALRNAWQSVFYGRKVFDLVKAFKTTEPDVEKATLAMHAALADTEQRQVIEEKVQDQADQFNSPGYNAERTTEYIPAYRRGARLVHAWINAKNTSVLPSLPPVDFAYLGNDMSDEQKEKRQYSLLDLIPPDSYVVLCGPNQRKYVELCELLQRSSIPARLVVCGKDFTFTDEVPDGYGLSKGNAVLIRPDQHVELVIENETVEEIVKHIASSLHAQH